MINFQDYHPIGHVSKTHGTDGKLSCDLLLDLYELENLEFLFLEIDACLIPFYVESLSISDATRMLVKLEDIHDPEEASTYRGYKLYLPAKILEPILDQSKNYQSLQDYSLYNANDSELVGTVTQVDNYSDNLVMRVATPQQQELLLPLHEDLIAEINHEAKSLHLQIPEGLY